MKISYGTTEERVKNALHWYSEKKTGEPRFDAKLREHISNELELSDQEYELYLDTIFRLENQEREARAEDAHDDRPERGA